MAFMQGVPSHFKKISRFRPGQSGMFDQLSQMAMSGLQSGAGDFEPIRQREIRGFDQDILPTIAQRLTNMGSQSSGSARQEAFQRAGTDLSTNLAALGSQHALQREGNLMNMLNLGLTPQDKIGFFGAQPSGLSNFGGTFLSQSGPMMAALVKGMFGGFSNKDEGLGVQGGDGQGGGHTGKVVDIATQAASGGAKGGPIGAAVSGGTAALKNYLPLLIHMLMKSKSEGEGAQGSGSVTYNQPV